MASQTRSAGLGQNITMSGGQESWNSPTSIYTSNDVHAGVTFEWEYAEISHWLRATTFGFTIPVGATIDGIIVYIEKKCNEAYVANDYSLKLVKAGAVVGSDKATATPYPTVDTVVPAGGATDLWGTTWTPAQINASNFGVGLSSQATLDEEIDVCTVRVDHIYITVYYTALVGTNIKINVGDSWKIVTAIEINIGDVWKPVTSVQINIGDSWKTLFG